MSLLDSLLGGYVFAQQNGAPSAVPSRRTLIFAGAQVIDDGPTANSTTILISGGGGSFPGGDLCSGTGTSVAVGSGLVLASGTLSAPSPFVHASTQLLNGAGGAVTVGSRLTFAGGTLSADNQFTGTSLQLSAGDGSAVTVGSGLTLAAGTITAAGGGGGASVGTFAARPAVGTTGQVYIPTDQGGAAVYDGSEWRPMVDQYVCKRVDLASLTWLNQGSYTASQQGDALAIDSNKTGQSTNLSGLYKSGSSYSISSGRVVGESGQYLGQGVFMRESATQQSAALFLNTTPSIASGGLSYFQYNSDTSLAWYNNSTANLQTFPVSPFLKISASGKDAQFWVGFSPFGPWVLLYTRANVWTTAPDQVGIQFYSLYSGYASQALITHFDGA